MSVLLESLAFSLSDKEIMWNLGMSKVFCSRAVSGFLILTLANIVTPSVNGSVKPQLPLIVSKV